MTSAPPRPKLIYRPKNKLEVFYTGGFGAEASKDGSTLVCPCADEVKVVDLGSGTVLHTLTGDTEPVTALALSPDGSWVAAASRSLTCRCWDVKTGALLRSWRAHSAPIADLAIDANGSHIATAGADRSVRVWSADSGYCTHSFTGHNGVVMKVLFHPQQMLLMSAGDDSDVRVWDLVDKTCVATLKGHFSAVTCLSLSPDGWYLLSGGRDQVVVIWDLRTNNKVATIPVLEPLEGLVTLPLAAHFPGVDPPVPQAKPVPGSKKPVFFATGGESGAIKVWRSDTASCTWQQLAPPKLPANQIIALGTIPSQQTIFFCTADCRILMYKAQMQDGKRTLDLNKQQIGNHDEVTDLRFIGPPAAPTHLAVSSNSEVVRLFELHSGLSCTLSLVGHKEAVLAMDASYLGEDLGNVLVTASKDQTLRVWHAPSGACLGHGSGHVAAVTAVALSRKAKGSFVVSGAADKLIKVWDVSTLTSASALSEDSLSQKKKPSALKVIAATAAHDKDINVLAISPNDAWLCSGSQDKTAKLWQLPNLVPGGTLRGHKRGVWSVEFSPVDQVVLTSSGDKTIRLWSIQSSQCLKTFEGHTASVLRACFLTLGTQVVSCGADGLVKLWSTSSTESIATFDEHTDKIWALTSSGENQKLIASGGADARVIIWEDTTAEDAQNAAEEEDQLLQQEQELQNALMDEDFAAAARVAFRLGHPGRLLKVVHSLTGQGTQAEEMLQGLVAHMSPEELKAALEYVREWNTNSRNCHAAHAMLHAILHKHPPTTLTGVPGLKELLQGLVPYTQRHFQRMDRLLRSTYLLDYTLARMNVLMPTDADMACEEPGSCSEEEEEDIPLGPMPRMVAVVDDEDMDEDEDGGERAEVGEGENGHVGDDGEGGAKGVGMNGVNGKHAEGEDIDWSGSDDGVAEKRGEEVGDPATIDKSMPVVPGSAQDNELGLGDKSAHEVDVGKSAGKEKAVKEKGSKRKRPKLSADTVHAIEELVKSGAMHLPGLGQDEIAKKKRLELVEKLGLEELSSAHQRNKNSTELHDQGPGASAAGGNDNGLPAGNVEDPVGAADPSLPGWGKGSDESDWGSDEDAAADAGRQASKGTATLHGTSRSMLASASDAGVATAEGLSKTKKKKKSSSILSKGTNKIGEVGEGQTQAQSKVSEIGKVSKAPTPGLAVKQAAGLKVLRKGLKKTGGKMKSKKLQS